MIGWSIILIIGLAIILCVPIFIDEDKHFWILILLKALGILLVSAALVACIGGKIAYRNWETSFNLLKNYIENRDIYVLDSVKRVIDIAEINEELFYWQTSRLNWGIFSMAPKSVLSLTPII